TADREHEGGSRGRAAEGTWEHRRTLHAAGRIEPAAAAPPRPVLALPAGPVRWEGGDRSSRRPAGPARRRASAVLSTPRSPPTGPFGIPASRDGRWAGSRSR